MIRIVLAIFILSFLACSESAEQEASSVPTSLVDSDTGSTPIPVKLQALLSDLDTSKLREAKLVSEIPPFIMRFLDSLTTDFSIANPGDDWQETCTDYGTPVHKKVFDKESGDSVVQMSFDNNRPLPTRELIYFGYSSNLVLMSYYTGGFGKAEHVMIMRIEGDRVMDFWHQYILHDLTTRQQILEFLRTNRDRQWALSAGITYY